MNLKRRRRWVGLGFTITVMLIGASSLFVASQVYVANQSFPAQALTVHSMHLPDLSVVKRIPLRHPTPQVAKQVPVLAYHAMNNGCPSDALPVCKSKDYETMSTAQFQQQMSWMYKQGYHALTMTQYLRWLRFPNQPLVPKPFLIIDDNDDSDWLIAAEPILYHYRFVATPVIVTGFALAANNGYCKSKYMVADKLYNIQPGCGGPNTWNMTWAGLRALSPQVYNYSLEAGPAGHYQQTYDKKCTAYYACKIPGETNVQYKKRVIDDIEAGLNQLIQNVGKRANIGGWVVPYSDAGYKCQAYSCAYEQSTGPRSWLIDFAAANFQAVFVQDYYRNGVARERFRYEIHNTTTIAQFRHYVRTYLQMGAWSA